MDFSFTDYTFSGLLSVLAALYGVGYPLIIQSIGRISAQYNSERISKKFLEDPIYVAFQVLLVINLVCAIAAPFILHAGWNNILVITVQAVLLVLLMGQTFLLFRLILRFGSAPDLLRHLESSAITKKNVHHIFDLAVYADAKHLLSLYTACMTDVFGYVYVQQGDKKGSLAGDVTPAPKYDVDTFMLAWRIKEYLRNDDGHHYLYGHNDVVAAFFNQFSTSRIGMDSRRIMWHLANEAIASDNRLWFMQYWQIADGYVSFKYRFIGPGQKELYNDKLEFLAHHVMIGTALLHFKRFSWLNDVFFYTHSVPEYYGLIPSSFSEIIKILRFIDTICNEPAFGGRQFYYRDSMAGATDEKSMFREAVCYLSLLIIRLWSLKDRRLDSEDLWSAPSLPIQIPDEKREIKVLQMMEEDIYKWFKTSLFVQMPNLTEVADAEVTEFVREYRECCEVDMKEKEEHPIVSKAKYDTLFKEVMDAAQSFKPAWAVFSGEKPWGNEKVVVKDVGYKNDLESLYFSEYMEIGVGKLGIMNWRNFSFSLYRGYLDAFKEMKLLKLIRIPRAKVLEVLSEIGLSSNYAIIASDAIDGLPPSAIVLNASVLPISLYILPVNNVPLAELNPFNASGFEQISKDLPYTTNLPNFINYRDPIFKFQIAVSLKTHLNAKGVDYVRIIIDDDPQVRDNLVEVDWTLNDVFNPEPKEPEDQEVKQH